MPSLSSFLVPGARVAVVGSRDFPEPSLVESFVVDLPQGVCVVSGSDIEAFEAGSPASSCGGAVDLAAAAAARSAGLQLQEFPALWGRYGRSAGPRRNRQLVASGISCMCVFLSSPGKPSPGSAGVVKLARAAGVQVFVFGPAGQLC